MTQQIQPLAHRVLVQRLAPEKTSAIETPDQFVKKSRFAKVIAVGSGRWLETGEHAPMSVAPGEDVAIFRGHELTLDGQECVFVNEEDILAVIFADNLMPLNNWVMLKRRTADEKTEGGIVIPEICRSKHQDFDVIDVGPGKLLENGSRAPMFVNIGDRIHIKGGVEIMWGGIEYIFAVEDGIVGVIT